MNTFLQILTFEIRYRLKRPATYAYFIILFLMAFLAIYTRQLTIGESSGLVNRNSPYMINIMVMVMVIFGTMICSAVMGVPVFRDFENGFHEIMFTTPVKKWQYLAGRFWGSYMIALFIFSGLLFGNLIGSVFPGVDTEHIGPFMLKAYLVPFYLYIIPNVLMLGALFFAMGSLFRSQLAIYVQGVVLFALYLIIISNQRDIENSRIFSILDPFGFAATDTVTRYWTIAEKNTLTVPLTGLLLYNRLLWMGIAVLISVVFYRLFKFSKAGLSAGRKKKEEREEISLTQTVTLPHADYSFAGMSALKQWWFLVRFHYKSMIRAVPFIAITLCGVLILLAGSTDIGSAYGTQSFPVTYMILDLLTGNFMLFIIIIITFYSGELIWKEIGARFANIADATPPANMLFLSAKFTAMIFAEVLLLVVLVVTGIIIQTINGFYDYQLSVYIKSLALNTFPYLILITLLTFFVHSLVNNKFLGHTIVIIFWVGNIFMAAMDINHNLLWYGNAPSASYSAMNGLGHFVFPVLMFDLYWLAAGLLLFMLGLLMMKRGSEIDFLSRFRKIKQQWKSGTGRVMIPLCLAAFFLSGGFIYYNTNVLNNYRRPNKERKLQAAYETKYRKYRNMNQPRITDVSVQVDIFPYERRVNARGTYRFKNRSGFPIDSVLVMLPELAKTNSNKFSSPAKELINEKTFGLTMYRFEHPLAPGDSGELSFDVSYYENGFPNDGGSRFVVYNGTFVNNDLFPHFGYDEGKELTDDDRRKDEKLPKKLYRMNPISDTLQYKNTYLSTDADWVSYEAIVSTSPDQIAISPGYLQKEWTENGRRYFHYKMDSPIWNFFSFLSARYEVLRDKHNGVNIEIYYHKGHEYDLKSMVKGIKKTLDYAGENFSPYQHRQVRIIEFPRYQLFAQSFPNTIPFSEGIGFIADVDKESDIDMAYYVTSHEVAHQWWGHQVAGANVQGSTMIVESMAQYTALMVMEHEFGKPYMEKFLKYELDGYLGSRTRERKREQPLMMNENQQYIHYQKGSLVLYALKDYLGEDSLNAALARFINDYAFKGAPYPTAIDFVSYIKQATPDSMKFLITDLCETITLFNNKAIACTEQKNPDGSYRVNLEVECRKFRADSIGNETELEVKDWIDVGVYTAGANDKDSLIYIEKRKMKQGINKFTIDVNHKPSKAGIDPIHILIDRNTDDNTKAAGES